MAATSKQQKSGRKRLRCDSEESSDDDDIGGDGATVSIIPTPSIDLVLQNLATNALASTAAPEMENEEQDDAIQLDGSGSSAAEEEHHHQQQQPNGQSVSSGCSSSRQSTEKEGDQKLRRMQARARRQRVSKWKISETAAQRKKQMQKSNGNKGGGGGGVGGALAYSVRSSSSTTVNKNSISKKAPNKKKQKVAARTARKNNIVVGDGGEEAPAVTKTAKTLAELLQYSNIVAANLENKRTSPMTSKNDDPPPTADGFTFTAANREECPSSSKSIATLITDRFRPNTGTFYRYTPAPVVTPAVVHKLLLNARQASSTIGATINDVVAAARSAVATKPSSSASSSSLVSSSRHTTTRIAGAAGVSVSSSSLWPSSTATTTAAVPKRKFRGGGRSIVGCSTTTNGGANQQQQIAAGPTTMTTVAQQQQDDEDVVVLEEDSSGDQQQGEEEEDDNIETEEQETAEESAPFCQNCASEIPLILRNLDRLDNMVTSMIASVEQKIQQRRHPPQQPPPPPPSYAVVRPHNAAVQFMPYNGSAAGPSSSLSSSLTTFAPHLSPAESVAAKTHHNSVLLGVNDGNEAAPSSSSTSAQPNATMLQLNVQQVQQQQPQNQQLFMLNHPNGLVVNIGDHVHGDGGGYQQQSTSASSSMPLPDKILDDDDNSPPPRLTSAIEQDGDEIPCCTIVGSVFAMRVLFALPCHHCFKSSFAPQWTMITSFRSAASDVPSAVGLSSDWLSDSCQLIHKSRLPTYHFQKSLFRLPVPTLEHSCDRYLCSVGAVFGEHSDEFVDSKELVADFLDGTKGGGPALQAELKRYAQLNKHTSYISEPWFDMYLRSRTPCPINFNPFMMFAPDPEPIYNDQLIRATNLVISCGRFKKALDAELLKPEVFHMNPLKSDTEKFENICRFAPNAIRWLVAALAFKAYPLDMSQYQSLFGGCRIPQRDKDRLHLNRNSKHFVVSRHGHFYTVKLFDQNGMLLEPKQIFASLSHICKSPPSSSASKTNSAPADECVGSLTTLDRDTWADIRSELIGTDSRNHEALTAIEDGLFLLCLDDLNSTDPERLMHSLLCGDDGSNRWFDKCFQLIVDGNGQATINFEHSWGDGVAVLRLMEETLKDTVKNRFIHSGGKDGQGNSEFGAVDVQKIEWKLNDILREKIRNAQKVHLDNTSKLDFGVVLHTAMSKEDIKRARLSPDAMMQLAFQMAFHSVYREFVPTYESCSTAAFLKGRTECVRSATSATRHAVEAFEKGSLNKSEMRTLLNNCSQKHFKLVKEASLGKGFDRHFFGLRLAAQRLGHNMPKLFANPIYERMNHFVLSTSTLSTDTIHFGGFGPVVPDGIGIGYNVTDTKLGAVAITYNDKRSAKEFVKALDASLVKIQRVLRLEEN
ncbi:hypothetical protein niasHT_002132 [Heterodera trifolii]|uniref:Choline/carnitine acyltransferase domain-containing protein n=1 Tax=Heterodera trifolii TaxID=157864 RepID=A0ABD2MD26_9BILA